MARCEQTLSNSPGEVHALVEAARLFLEAECTNQMLMKCPGFEEHLITATNWYNFAIKGLNKPDQAMSYCQRATDLHFVQYQVGSH
ncbi:40-kDa huntingtin-associated protein-like [Branchiostoma floridae x Branchiostoma belcheri]